MIKADNCPLCLTNLSADQPLFYYGRGAVGVDVQRTKFLRKNFDFDKNSLDYEKINPASVPAHDLVMKKDLVMSVTVNGAEYIQKVCPNCGSFLSRRFGKTKLNRYCIVSSKSDLPMYYFFHTWDRLDEAKPDGWMCMTEMSDCYPKPREGRGHLVLESAKDARSVLALEIGADASLDASRYFGLQLTMSSGLIVVQDFESLKTRKEEKDFFDLITSIVDKCTIGNARKVKIPVALVLLKERTDNTDNQAGTKERLLKEIGEYSQRTVEIIESSIARFAAFEASGKFRNHEENALLWMMGWHEQE